MEYKAYRNKLLYIIKMEHITNKMKGYNKMT